MFAPFSFLGESGVIPTPPPAYVTKSIVTEGLQMYVDANSSFSYGGSGASWLDLSTYYTASTAKNLTLDATPTFVESTPNYFDFTDGTDAAQYKPGGTLTEITSTTNTICMFFAYHGSTSNYRTIVRSASGGAAIDFILVNTGTNNLGTYTAGFNAFGVNISSDIPSYTTQFNYQVFTTQPGRAGNDTQMFLNAASGSAIGGTENEMGNGPALFGNQQTGGQPGAKIAAILVYDRVLTTAEIGQNYEALKADMGL